MYSQHFLDQVKLLIQCLPALCDQNEFALKGGTAINLFIRDLPRLSVDIDLTFLPLLAREDSLQAIQAHLFNLGQSIQKALPDVLIQEKRTQSERILTKLLVYRGKTVVKIEPNFVLRGAVLPIEKATLTPRASDLFSAEVSDLPMLAKDEVYAGKLCAALSRQHPRDLFDVKLLLEAGPLSDTLRQVFVVYLACSARPMNELLSPNLQDLQMVFNREFAHMTHLPVTLGELQSTLRQLVTLIQGSLTDQEKQFLISIKKGNPDFTLLPFANLDKLPAIQWKLMNIAKMSKAKQAEMLDELQRKLG